MSFEDLARLRGTSKHRRMLTIKDSFKFDDTVFYKDFLKMHELSLMKFLSRFVIALFYIKLIVSESSASFDNKSYFKF